jgi:hypothetical protein
VAKPNTLKRAWVTTVLTYAVIRTIAIWHVFEKYGVNPYFYLGVDVFSSFFYAKYSTKLIIEANQTHYRKLLRYLGLTLIFNFIPDIYVLATANKVPKFILQSFIEIILILALVAAFAIFREIKNRRAI